MNGNNVHLLHQDLNLPSCIQMEYLPPLSQDMDRTNKLGHDGGKYDNPMVQYVPLS